MSTQAEFRRQVLGTILALALGLLIFAVGIAADLGHWFT